MVGQRDSSVGKAVSLYMADPRSIPDTLYGPLSLSWSDFLSTELGTSPEHYWVWTSNQTNKQNRTYQTNKQKIQMEMEKGPYS